ncbi:hypothetical protein GCM10028805_40280 [Spirosoma harenae]
MKSCTLTSFLLLLIFTAYGQTPRTVYRSYPIIIPSQQPYVAPVTYQLHDGIAQLDDGSLLAGRFMYNRNSGFNFYENGHSPGKNVPFYRFERLTLTGADTSVLPRTDSTVFLRVSNRLFRRLTVGKVGLYDRVYAINEDKGKIGDVLFTWSDNGKLKRLRNLEEANKWFYEVCIQNKWPNPDVFLSKTEIIKRLAQLDPVP